MGTTHEQETLFACSNLVTFYKLQSVILFELNKIEWDLHLRQIILTQFMILGKHLHLNGDKYT